ncbi:MAG TPA: peptide chain release factor N(5)-glutamine methyltransferase [Leucothrix sp.]|nr:peptide chain release factor N(5)-glutamine methyltransferase [Leucothrix sp.]
MRNADNSSKPTPPLFDIFSLKGQLSIAKALAEARTRLADISDSPALDAELLLASCLKKNQTYLHTWPEKIVNTAQHECFQKHLEKRLDDYPIAYLLGEKAFWTLDLIVTPDVLIPRPETELLVETALDRISKINQPKVLDLGTGSGSIALAIASERPDASIIACDSSNAALKIATQNAIKNKLEDQVRFIQSNWFSDIQQQEFDLIVSNPPYIAPEDPHLLQSIRHEPVSALAAENNGMADIEIIIKNSTAYLKPKSCLIIEHGYNQAKQTQQLFLQSNYVNIESFEDLNKIQRITMAFSP